MDTVTVTTPSRLHFALIDLCGHLGRIDGSIGLALAEPHVRITARRASGWTLVGEAPAPVMERAQRILEMVRRITEVPGAHLTLERFIPQHVGLGAGTQLALGLARAVYALYDLPWDTREVARRVGRGGTSGIGVWAFERGGFLLDGGHTFPGQKRSFLPSSAARDTPTPPLLLRYDFPDWPVLLVTPRCRHISGAEEVRRFQTLCPLPPHTAEQNAHIILMQLLPALVERDLPGFCEALNRLQEIGWKRVEHEAQGPIVRKTREFLLAHGALGVALSSWGPTMAAFAEDPDALEVAARQFCQALPEGGRVIRTHANNLGAQVAGEEHHGPL